jgi:hypothetical protein
MTIGRRTWLLLLLAAAMVRSGMEVSATAQTPETWMAGVPPVGQHAKHISDPTYLQMFEPGAPWKVSGSGLTVFKTSMQAIDQETDAQLQTMFAALRERHIKFAIESGLLGYPTSGCGNGIEGFISPGGPLRSMQHIKRLGGVVDYIAMDEPMLYGHRAFKADKTVGCQFPLPQVADMIADQVKAMRTVFPDLQVGDIEPIGGGPTSGEYNREVVQLAALLRQRTDGTVPAFFHADMQWATPGTIQAFEQLAQQMHNRHIPVGVICNGGGQGITTGQQWVANAVQRCGVISKDGKIAADTYILQTWETLPNKMLPETDPGSLTFGLKKVEAMVGATSKK